LAARDFIVMLQVTTNVEAYRPKCTWNIFEYLQYLYYTSRQLLFYLRRNSINGSHEATLNRCVKHRTRPFLTQFLKMFPIFGERSVFLIYVTFDITPTKKFTRVCQWVWWGCVCEPQANLSVTSVLSLCFGEIR